VGIGPEILLRHDTRSRAATVASLHEPKPNAVLSFSAVLRQVSFGLPRLLLPSVLIFSQDKKKQVMLVNIKHDVLF